MFTILAFIGACLIAWQAMRNQVADATDSETNIRHSRQDLRLIAFLLFGILIMLGVIADRI
jgi:hypothetical protein